MEGDGPLPTAPPSPTTYPIPALAAPSAPKRKAQRRLGLPPPPSTDGSGTSVAGGEEGSGVKPTRKRPPRDPSLATAARKSRTAAAGRPPLQVSPAPPELASPAYSTQANASPAPSAASPIAPTATMPVAQEVLGEMPPNVDDESFLNMMDGQTFGNTACYVDANLFDAIDDEIGSDADGELTKKKGSRGVNFSIA